MVVLITQQNQFTFPIIYFVLGFAFMPLYNYTAFSLASEGLKFNLNSFVRAILYLENELILYSEKEKLKKVNKKWFRVE